MDYGFTIKKRELTEIEKYRRAIFFYKYDDLLFDFIYENDIEEYDEYNQPLIKVKENFDRLDDETKKLVRQFVTRQIIDERIDYKCLNCNFQENNIAWDEIEDNWNKKDVPKMYCPKCGKPQFVPLDVWNKKNKYSK